MRADPNPGFDVARAVEVLHRKAQELGAKPSPGGDPHDAYDVSLRHVMLHDVPHDLLVDGHPRVAERCLVTPCRIGGLCFALQEILQFQRELTTARTRASMELTDVARELESVARPLLLRFARVAADFVRTSKVQHEWESKLQAPGQFHDHESTCRRPRDAVYHGAQMLSLVGKLGNELPSLLESAELAQPPARKRSTILLTAVYQHLSWGGWNYREIAELVPDQVGGRHDARTRRHPEDRVRHRVKSAEARSLFPADVLDGNGKAAAV